MPTSARPNLDRVILSSDPPGMVNGVALPEVYTWRQAKGEVIASNCDDIPVGSLAYVQPGAGERVYLGGGKWALIVEEHEVLALIEDD